MNLNLQLVTVGSNEEFVIKFTRHSHLHRYWREGNDKVNSTVLPLRAAFEIQIQMPFRFRPIRAQYATIPNPVLFAGMN